MKLPALSLGAWHNFGAAGSGSHGITDECAFHEHARDIILTAFDHSITHIDLANNYGPPPALQKSALGAS